MLRHVRAETTAIYAKVDRTALVAAGPALAGRCGMIRIRPAIADYLAVRRALGYKLEDHAWLLADFASFLEGRGAATITTELAMAWATLPADALPSWWAARLRVVRGFARHVKAFDPATRSRRWDCCPAATGAPCPTSTPTPR